MTSVAVASFVTAFRSVSTKQVCMCFTHTDSMQPQRVFYVRPGLYPMPVRFSNGAHPATFCSKLGTMGSNGGGREEMPYLRRGGSNKWEA